MGAGLKGTATTAQFLDAVSAQPTLVLAAPGLMSVTKRMSPAAVPVAVLYRLLCPVLAVAVLASPPLARAPTTHSLGALTTVAEGVSDWPVAPTAVPMGVVWLTPERFMASAARFLLALKVITTLAVPTVGLSRYHRVARVLVEIWSAALASATPP